MASNKYSALMKSRSKLLVFSALSMDKEPNLRSQFFKFFSCINRFMMCAE